MNVDSAFIMGNAHKVCQDYAIGEIVGGESVGTEPQGAYVILCDGCSDSSNVDFGARILAHVAQTVLLECGGETNYKEFGDVVITRAFDALTPFPMLTGGALNATLLVAWIKEDRVRAYIYGDGMMTHIKSDMDVSLHVGFKNDEGKSFPAYLSYNLHGAEAKKRYLGEAGMKHITYGTTYKNATAGGQSTSEASPFHPVIYDSTFKKGDIIALSSDGVNSFVKADGAEMSWWKVASEFFGFKNTNGEFVQRRLQAFERQCQKEQVKHYDDISVAAIEV